MLIHLLPQLALAAVLGPGMVRRARRLEELRAFWGAGNVDPGSFTLYDAHTGHPFRMIHRPGGGWAKTSTKD